MCSSDLAYLSDFISSLLKVKLPITVDRVNALTSRAKFCQKRFEEVYGHSYKTSMKEEKSRKAQIIKDVTKKKDKFESDPIITDTTVKTDDLR